MATAPDVLFKNFLVSISLSPLLREHSLLLCKREPAEGLESAARWSLNCQNNRSIPCSQLRPSYEIVETGSFSNSIFCPAFSHPSFFLWDNGQVWLDRALLPLNRQTFSHRWAADHTPTTPSSQGCYVSPWNYIFWRLIKILSRKHCEGWNFESKTLWSHLPEKSSQLIPPFPSLLAQILRNVNCASGCSIAL